MPSSTLESWSVTGLETTAPRVGACFLGLFGRALPKCVKAVLDGNSGTVSTISAELLEAPPLALGVLVKRSGESSTTAMLGRIFRPCNFLLDVCGVEMGDDSDFCDVASDPVIDSCSSDSDTETERFLSTSGVKLRFFFVLPTCEFKNFPELVKLSMTSSMTLSDM